MKDIFDRLSLEEKDIFSRIKLDLFDKIDLELADILEKKLELTEEVRNYIKKQVENIADEIISKNVSKIKVDSLSSKDVETIVDKCVKEEEFEKKIEKSKKEIREEVEKLLKELKKKNAAMMNDFYSKSGNFYQFGGYRLTVTEEDGTPTGIPTTLKFSNGTVTNNEDGSFSVTTGSSGAPTNATFVTLTTDATLTDERVVTGTANQIVITDNGAGSTVVLSTPQDIATSSSPTFNGLTLTTPLPLASGGTGQATAILAFNSLSPLTTLGDTLYNDGTNDVRLAGNTTTTKNILVQTGDGVNSAAPAWGTLADGDIPATVVRTSLTLTAGAGLTGGGDLSANRTFDVGAGTGITVNANDVALTIPVVISSGGTGQITAIAAFNALSPLTTLGDTLYNDGTNDVRLAGNITATKNFLVQTGNGAVSAAPSWGTIVDGDIPSTLVRTSVTLTAGAGLTGGGDLSANRTFDVGAGTGITVNANDVALTIPVVVTSGGTGLITVAQGDLLFGSAANTLSALAKNASATRYLSNTGTSNNPAWAQVDVSNGITGTVPVLNGGTGQTTYTNGQLLIGNTTGNTLTKATLTGTANQVVVTNSTGSITLSTPQDIGTGSTPTFSDLTLSSLTANQLVVTGASGAINVLGAATNGQIPIGSTGASPTLAGITGTSNQITVTNGAGTITLSTPQNIHTAATPTFASLTLSGLTANSFLYSGTAGLLTTTVAPTNGQLLIGSTGAAPVRAALTGTSNQITVTNAAGSITLSTPQDIATTSSPTFDGLLLAIVNKTTTYTITASDYVVTCDASGGAFTVTLPTAVGKTGQMFHIKKTDSTINSVTIATTSSQTVDGDTTVLINTQYETYMVISDGANFHIL